MSKRKKNSNTKNRQTRTAVAHIPPRLAGEFQDMAQAALNANRALFGTPEARVVDVESIHAGPACVAVLLQMSNGHTYPYEGTRVPNTARGLESDQQGELVACHLATFVNLYVERNGRVLVLTDDEVA